MFDFSQNLTKKIIEGLQKPEWVSDLLPPFVHGEGRAVHRSSFLCGTHRIRITRPHGNLAKRTETYMTHYQEQYQCSVCKRKVIVDITSIGTGHQIIQAITCYDCAIKVGGNIMEKNQGETL